MVKVRAFVFYMSIPFDKTFLNVGNKFKVISQGQLSRSQLLNKWPLRGHSCFTNTFFFLIQTEEVEEPIDEEEDEAQKDEEKEKDDDDDEADVEEEKDEDKPKTKKVTKTVWDWVLVNDMKPLWTRKYVMLIIRCEPCAGKKGTKCISVMHWTKQVIT